MKLIPQLETEIQCLICNKDFKNLKGLGQHLKVHNINSKEYTLKYLLNDVIPTCKCGCGNSVKVYPFKVGICYNSSCSAKYLWKTLDRNSDEYNIINNSRATKTKNRHRSNPNNVSFDFNDWKINCQCGNVIPYNSRNSYKNAIRNGTSCKECRRQKCIGRIFSDADRLKMSKSAKSRIISNEVEVVRRKKLSDAQLNRYKNMSTEERQKLSRQISDGWKNISNDQLIQIGLKHREYNLNRIYNSNSSNIFKPAYNKMTIEYIVDVLNIRYETQFQHAESNGGEFKIYDAENKCFYFADAYCINKNIWVEFDEPSKFVFGELKDKCKYREEQIIKLLNPIFLRIKFDKQNAIKE